jgi:hypothetical protein
MLWLRLKGCAQFPFRIARLRIVKFATIACESSESLLCGFA